MKRFLILLLLLGFVAACESPLEPSNVDTDDDQSQVVNVFINIGGDDNSGNDDGKGDGDGNGTVNQPPIIVSPGDQANFVGDNVLLQIIASDPDGDTLVWSITGMPRGLVISQTGLISGPVSSSSAIDSPWTAATVIVADGNRNTSGVVFTWTVTALE